MVKCYIQLFVSGGHENVSRLAQEGIDPQWSPARLGSYRHLSRVRYTLTLHLLYISVGQRVRCAGSIEHRSYLDIKGHIMIAQSWHTRHYHQAQSCISVIWLSWLEVLGTLCSFWLALDLIFLIVCLKIMCHNHIFCNEWLANSNKSTNTPWTHTESNP